MHTTHTHTSIQLHPYTAAFGGIEFRREGELRERESERLRGREREVEREYMWIRLKRLVVVVGGVRGAIVAGTGALSVHLPVSRCGVVVRIER